MLRAEERIGPYTLIRQLGKGSFGVVWLAERRGKFITTQVALKIPIDDEPDIEAIQNEAQSWLQVTGHPNVLPVLDADEYEGQIVIASEYAPDGSLADWMKKHGGRAPSVQAALEMICGTLHGLEHLHSRMVIHRDMKPGNVLLQGQTPRLTDFGVSRVLRSATATRVAGTPAYMAPEMFDGLYSEQTDLWAVGVMLYKMLSGTLPFTQQGWGALYAAIKEDEPAPLPESIPEPIRAIVAKALAKDPSQRFRSAREMRHVIAEAVSHLAVEEFAAPEPEAHGAASEAGRLGGQAGHGSVHVSGDGDSGATSARDSRPTGGESARFTVDSRSTGSAAHVPELPPMVTVVRVPDLPAAGFGTRTTDPPSGGSSRSDLPIPTTSSGAPTTPGFDLPPSYRHEPVVPDLAPIVAPPPPVVPGVPDPASGRPGREPSESTDSSNSGSGRSSTDTGSRPSFWPFNKAASPSKIYLLDGAEMVWVGQGEFAMGDPDQPDNPRQRFTLDGYWIYRLPVTVAMFRRFCSIVGRQMPQPPPWGWIDDHPMVNVHWEDAVDYCKWAHVSLPTEAQWEKAARGADARRFPWGNNWDPNRCHCSRSNYADAGSTVLVGAHPTGTSPYGVMDMAGNVWEWCHEAVGERSYDSSGSARRVLRGGSWESNLQSDFRTSFRQRQFPSYMYFTVGFRCVLNGEGP